MTVLRRPIKISPSRAVLWSALVLALAAALGSCAGPPQANGDPLGAVPADFTLEAAVLRGSPAPADAPADLRPGRYVIFSDGSLHFEFTGDGGAQQGSGLPPLTRVLTREQMAQVWSLLGQLGFTRASAADEHLQNLSLLRPQRDELVQAIVIGAGGRRWNVIRRGSPGQSPEPALTQVIARLAELAWASDAPPPVTVRLPRRYDFGPDPYQRYRGGQ